MRPPSGLFHAVFVFSGLLRYWRFVERTADGDLTEYAADNVRRIEMNLEIARPILFATALTEAGHRLASHLYQAVADR